MRKNYLLGAGLALGLMACAAPIVVPPAATGAIAQADRVVLSAERGFAVAELFYITAADGARMLADRGMIHGSAATALRALNARGRNLLVKGKAATDKVEKARTAAELFDVGAQIDALTGRK